GRGGDRGLFGRLCKQHVLKCRKAEKSTTCDRQAATAFILLGYLYHLYRDPSFRLTPRVNSHEGLMYFWAFDTSVQEVQRNQCFASAPQSVLQWPCRSEARRRTGVLYLSGYTRNAGTLTFVSGSL